MINITFNTSRLYTKSGQIISASFDPETSVIKFVDHSRMCEGQFTTIKKITEDDPFTFAKHVMFVYDRYGKPAKDYEYWITEDHPEQQETIHQFQI